MNYNNYTFIEVLNTKHSNPRIIATIKICGQQYDVWDYDTYINTAIKLASKWPVNERSFSRILHMRGWLRENVQHDLKVHIGTIRTLSGCKKLIDKIIQEEYRYAEPDLNDSVNQLANNAKIMQP